MAATPIFMQVTSFLSTMSVTMSFIYEHTNNSDNDDDADDDADDERGTFKGIDREVIILICKLDLEIESLRF